MSVGYKEEKNKEKEHVIEDDGLKERLSHGESLLWV